MLTLRRTSRSVFFRLRRRRSSVSVWSWAVIVASTSCRVSGWFAAVGCLAPFGGLATDRAACLYCRASRMVAKNSSMAARPCCVCRAAGQAMSSNSPGQVREVAGHGLFCSCSSRWVRTAAICERMCSGQVGRAGPMSAGWAGRREAAMPKACFSSLVWAIN